MGRKKKGDLSREQLLKTIDDNTDAEPSVSVRLPVSKPKMTTRVKILRSWSIMFSLVEFEFRLEFWGL